MKNAGKLSRKDSFQAEDALPESDRAELSDYERSGYDRGHMAPNANFVTRKAQAETFSLANMVPSSQPLSSQRAKSARPRAMKSITGKAMSSSTSIQRSTGSNSMPSNAATPPSRLTTLSRCRSPWHSRTRLS